MIKVGDKIIPLQLHYIYKVVMYGIHTWQEAIQLYDEELELALVYADQKEEFLTQGLEVR